MKRNFIVDEEISLSNGNDILKTEVYANTLSEVVSNSPKDKVFTIGLFGGWGTGKSSIIKTVREKMETSKVKFITYDAWKYANDSFRRMFLLKMQEELGFEQTEEMQRFYQSETAETKPKTVLSVKGLTIGIIVVAVLLALLWLTPLQLNWKVCVTSLGTLLSLVVALLNGCFYNLKISINKPALFAPEQFEACFKKMMSKCLKQKNWFQETWSAINDYVKLGKVSVVGLERLVVVIDNIDRCHSEMAYQLLTDIKTFLSDEKMNVVFIIPVDDEALKKNLFDSHCDRNCNKEKEEFLRKFFNVTIRIKPHQFTELNTFAKALNNKYNLGFNENTVALCSKEFATNPRRIIQLFNNLASELCLYPEDFAKKNESMICVVLILREEYADFYKKIVNDANELRNYKQEEKDNENHLPDFMRIANPIIRQTDMPNLLHILTNSDAVFDGIPADIKKRIESYATKETIEYINAHPESTEVVLDLIKRNVKEDVKSQSDAQLVNSIEFISAISCSISIPKPFLIEIEIDYLYQFYHILGMIDKQNWDNICHFALLMDHNDLPALKGIVLSYIADFSKIENEKVDDQIIKAALRTFQTKEDCKELNAVVIELFKTRGIFKDIDYSQDQKEIFFSNDLIHYFIEKINIGDNNTSDLFWLLENKDHIELATYSKLCGRLNNLVGNTVNKDKTQMFTVVKYVANFLLLIPDCSNIAELSTLNSKLWQRIVNNRTVCLLDEYNGDMNNGHFIIDVVFKIYKINSGTITADQVQKIVSFDKQYTYSKLLELKNQKIDIKPFWDIIIDDNKYESSPELLFPLLEFCILQKSDNGEFLIDSKKINNKVVSLCDNISKPGIPELVESLIKDDYLKQLFIDTIKTRDSNYINTLPPSLFELAINSFSQKNSSQYENNTGFLSVVASKGSDDQKTEIVKMMTANINNKRKLDETHSILENLELTNKSNKTMLLGAIQSFKDSTPNDNRFDSLISKFEN